MIATSVPRTVAITTTVTRPTAIPSRDRSIVRARARTSALEPDGAAQVTSSIVGGAGSEVFDSTGAPSPSTAKNTNAGFVVPVPVGRAAPASPGSTAVMSSIGPGPAGAAADAADAANVGTDDAEGDGAPRLEIDRRTSMACSWCSTDRRSPHFDHEVNRDSRMATTSKAMTRKKMLIPRPPFRPEAKSTTRRDIPALALELY